jgi:hypothetical protein
LAAAAVGHVGHTTIRNDPRSEHWRRCAAATALAPTIAAGTAGADPVDSADIGAEQGDIGLEHPEPPFDEPFDISTPMPARSGHGGVAPKFTAAPPSVDWSARVGIDNRMALPGAPEQSTGVGWANVTAPGVLTWDKTSVDTRVDPNQQGQSVCGGSSCSRSFALSAAIRRAASVLLSRTL